MPMVSLFIYLFIYLLCLPSGIPFSETFDFSSLLITRVENVAFLGFFVQSTTTGVNSQAVITFSAATGEIL